MMEFTFDYASLVEMLESQEIASPGGQTSPQVYGQLLAIYLLFNDLTSAKFLWKRIPDRIKSSNNELSLIWSIGKMMWRKNYSEIHRTIDSVPAWPNHLKNIMKLISESNRQRIIGLISRAYSSISLSNAAQLLGLSESDTLRVAEQLKWSYESDSGFLTITQCDTNQTPAGLPQRGPKSAATTTMKTASDSGQPTVMGLDNGKELLQKLTEYIIFLEQSK